MKRVSVAEARNHLPALLHHAESAPVEIVRRGKPVAVLLSSATYSRLEGRGDFVRALGAFRERHQEELEEFGDEVASDLCGLRDRRAGRTARI